MTSLRANLACAMLLAAACSGSGDGTAANGDVSLASAAGARPGQSDPLAARADSLVRAGRAWQATRLLAPRTASPAQQAPGLLLVAARAAAAWDGWTEVERLLRAAPWLDNQFDGEGRELLARSALDRNADARNDAALAVADAREPAARAMREVLLARALERANVRDSASALYAAAATRLPRVGDWLRLRAAGVTDDSARRGALLAGLHTSLSRARIGPTDAQAREKGGDFTGAAASYRKAGQEGAAFRVESLGARDSGARIALAVRIVSYLQHASSPGEVRQSIDVLDKLPSLGGTAELTVARAAASAGTYARAATGFSRAAAATPLDASDMMSWANALARTGRSADAQKTYASIADQRFAALAAYQRARLLAQGSSGGQAKSSLRSVATTFRTNRSAAAPALLLLADLQVDDAELSAASTTLKELLAQYPEAPQAPLARFRLGLLQWADSPAAAAATFDSLPLRYPHDEEVLPAQYWAARAKERTGGRAAAESGYRAIVRTAPMSYYAMLSNRRLGAPAWTPPAGPDSGNRVPALDSAVDRVRVLRALGMDVEAGFERDAIVARASSVPAEAASVVRALESIDEPARALRVALAGLDATGSPRALLLAAYPIVHDDALLEESRRNDLDPALVAGLVRQESNWNPHALSGANARGLMQLLPSVGASIAAGRKYPLWNTALLYEPDVSLELGTAHLASSLKRDTPPEQALAAYNAGASRVTRWLQRPGTSDAELFTEMIPFTETRDYVRLVLRNAAIYRALYQLGKK